MEKILAKWVSLLVTTMLQIILEFYLQSHTILSNLTNRNIRRLSNLTDTGRFRMFRLGLELRKIYSELISFDPSEILVFSSPVQRCLESLRITLNGLMNLETTMSGALNDQTLASNFSETDEKSGFAFDWQSFRIDTDTVPTLTVSSVLNCSYLKWLHSTEKNKLNSIDYIIGNPKAQSLIGYEDLKSSMAKRYNSTTPVLFSSIFSTVKAELELKRTQNTINYTSHFSDWINIPVKTRLINGKLVTLKLIDVLEQSVVLSYIPEMISELQQVHTGPIVKSLIDSQLVKLGRNTDSGTRYEQAKMIVYSTHDLTLTRLLYDLGVIEIDETRSFEDRFFDSKARNDNNQADLDEFLNGLKICNYGMSVSVELWMIKHETEREFPIVRMWIYNESDGKYSDIKYNPVFLGQVCQRLFKEQYPTENIGKFYNKRIKIDENLSCPFDLFQNVTSKLMITNEGWKTMCN